MKISKIKLKDFKGFDDLTIDLGGDPKKVIALVGPNGSGKSSIFDAFEEEQKNYKHGNRNEEASFFSKLFFNILEERRSETYNRSTAVKVIKKDGGHTFDKKSFYIRTAYRFTSQLKVDSITAQPDIIEDLNRPHSSSAIDARLQENYARMLGNVYDEVFSIGNKTGQQIIDEYVGRINDILVNILDIKITSLGNVATKKGQLYFEKGDSKDFPYQNLSSGEKEVIDIIIDLIIKTPEYNDTVFCIDEPELHLNTAIQRKLLIEIEKLIPENCQLWVATHSIGFLRSLQEELKDKSQIIDFSEKNYFSGTHTVVPIKPTRKNWQRIFKTALEDITGLVAPENIIYCEGTPNPSASGDEIGLDAIVYNNIFQEEFHNVLFVSSGGTDVEQNAAIALKVISKAFNTVQLFLLKDRDDATEAERQLFLSQSTSNKMLERREIENYLFDEEVLTKYVVNKGLSFDQTKYNQLVSDIKLQDLKPKGSTTLEGLKSLCGYTGKVSELMKELSTYIDPTTRVYAELKSCLF